MAVARRPFSFRLQMEHRSLNTDECHAHWRRERCLDLRDRARPHRQFRRAGYPGRRRTAPEHLLGDLRGCGPWNDLEIQGCNTVPNIDRHEERRVGVRQAVGGDSGHPRSVYRYTTVTHGKGRQKGRPATAFFCWSDRPAHRQPARAQIETDIQCTAAHSTLRANDG